MSKHARCLGRKSLEELWPLSVENRQPKSRTCIHTQPKKIMEIFSVFLRNWRQKITGPKGGAFFGKSLSGIHRVFCPASE